MKRSSKITAEQLCEKLGVDPTPFKMPYPEPPKPPLPPGHELAQVVDEPVRVRDQSLFDGLVGDIRFLLEDVQKFPEKYPDGTEEFLSELAMSRAPRTAAR